MRSSSLLRCLEGGGGGGGGGGVGGQTKMCNLSAMKKSFTNYSDVVPDHRNPKGMGGAWTDDHPDNIQATHFWCNEEKGSTRMDD